MQQTVVRSQFVTKLAWAFIAMSVLGMLVAIAQNLMVHMLMPELESAMAQARTTPGAPPFAGMLLGGLRDAFAFGMLTTACMLAASIGLLRRNNVARLAFITFLVLAIAWNVVGLGMQAVLFSHMPVQEFAQEGGLDMRPMFRAIFAFGVLLAVVIAGVFGWIIKRLTSPAIRAEFH